MDALAPDAIREGLARAGLSARGPPARKQEGALMATLAAVSEDASRVMASCVMLRSCLPAPKHMCVSASRENSSSTRTCRGKRKFTNAVEWSRIPELDNDIHGAAGKIRKWRFVWTRYPSSGREITVDMTCVLGCGLGGERWPFEFGHGSFPCNDSTNELVVFTAC